MKTVDSITLSNKIEECNFKEIKLQELKNLEECIEINFLYKGIPNSLLLQDVYGQTCVIDLDMDNMSMTDSFIDFVVTLLN